ncbi:MAG: fimbrial protein [Plesiomonas sp.]|uniref:fimbrial protein n=1 Tax=Plesiomonas sp. TaxID=2486279 RepID=UPI003F3C1E6A
MMTYTITGVAFAPACIINNNSDINVEFGNVNTESIRDGLYKVITVVPVECAYHTGTPKVTFSGVISPEFGNANILSTTKESEGLGIALYKGHYVDASHALPLNIAVDLNSDEFTGTQFSFTSLLIESGRIAVTPGIFTAVATIKIAYE